MIKKVSLFILVVLTCSSCNFRVGRDRTKPQSQSPSSPQSQSKSQPQSNSVELEKFKAETDAKLKAVKDAYEQELLKSVADMAVLTNTLMQMRCLTAETPVHVKAETGAQTKPISEVTDQDQVLSCEFGVCKFWPIEAISKESASDLYQLRYSGNQVINATSYHPFYEVVQDRWKPAKELEPGDVLYSVDGEQVKLESIEPLSGTHDVFNLKVSDNHSYFANGILTHNCSLFAAVYLQGAKSVLGKSRKLAEGGYGSSQGWFPFSFR